jgi:uncharacterized membrane protein YidH (DUF202 family)
MALATRPKPNTHDRKRQAGHHHHGKSYLETYWPYLPMFAVVAGGALLNSALYRTSLATPKAGAVISGASTGSSSRIQTLLGTQANWILFAVIIVTAITFTLFIVSHWYRLHRLMNKGEAYLISHPWLEISAVFIFTLGAVLTRGASLPH